MLSNKRDISQKTKVPSPQIYQIQKIMTISYNNEWLIAVANSVSASYNLTIAVAILVPASYNLTIQLKTD